MKLFLKRSKLSAIRLRAEVTRLVFMPLSWLVDSPLIEALLLLLSDVEGCIVVVGGGESFLSLSETARIRVTLRCCCSSSSRFVAVRLTGAVAAEEETSEDEFIDVVEEVVDEAEESEGVEIRIEETWAARVV